MNLLSNCRTVINSKILIVLNRLILVPYHASSGLKRNKIYCRLVALRTRSTSSKSVMGSIIVSKMGITELIFVDPGTKVNG